jgi:hypothetical protein
VELLRDVRLDRIEPQRRRRDPGEAENVVGRDDLGGTEHGIAEGDVDAERIAEWFPGKAALRSESHPLVLNPVAVDVGVLGVARYLEREEVVEVETRGRL